MPSIPSWISDAKAQMTAEHGRRSRFLRLTGPLSPNDVEKAAREAGLIPGGYVLLQDFEGGGNDAAWEEWAKSPTLYVRRYSTSNAETLRRFHCEPGFVRVTIGPYGSGKSTAHVNELVRLACQQAPNPSKVRQTRWAIVRNSFPQLTSTTIKTWQEWVPHSVCPIVYGSPIAGRMRQALVDGTEVDMEVFFIALNLPKDVDKLLSLELTGAWVNEAREIDRTIIDAITGRVGRYPAKISGAPITWSGIIADTNPPDELHFLYTLAEETPPEELPGWKFYKQPPAVLETHGQYRINPYCENLLHQPIGADYWLRMIPGKTREWIKVYLQGEYGTISEGKPIYEMQWSDSTHVRPCTLLRGVELIAGWDFGLTPAFVLGQVTPSGRLEILDEIVGDNIGVEGFVTDFVLPLLARKYAGYAIVHIGDPAGAQRAQTDERTVFDAMRRLGIKVQPAPTQDSTARWEAVRWFLTTMVEGKPRFALDPGCKVLRKGFGGGYCFRRIQVAGAERYSEAAEKNIFSHCADALQYACAHLRQPYLKRPDDRTKTLPQNRPADRYAGY